MISVVISGEIVEFPNVTEVEVNENGVLSLKDDKDRVVRIINKNCWEQVEIFYA